MSTNQARGSVLFDSPVNVFVFNADVLTDLFVPKFVGVAFITDKRIKLGIELRVQRAARYLVDFRHSFSSCRHLGGKGQGKTVVVDA